MPVIEGIEMSQDDVERLGLDAFHGLAPVGGRHDGHAVTCQDLRGRAEDRRFVIHEEQA
jgi:hypothetical protein